MKQYSITTQTKVCVYIYIYIYIYINQTLAGQYGYSDFLMHEKEELHSQDLELGKTWEVFVGCRCYANILSEIL